MFRKRLRDLSTVPLEELLAEVTRRGFTPQYTRELVDATDLWRELGRIASVEYPAAVSEIRGLYAEVDLLRSRVHRADAEAERLADLLGVGEEIQQLIDEETNG